MTDSYAKEEYLVGNGRGKWSQEGVPHKGWSCVEIEDLGRPSQTCEMCESQQIRYAHHMEHPRFGESLIVGCVCAGHMEQDLTGAKIRDKQMRSRSAKRRRWLTRVWKVSGKGNDWIRADDYRVTVYKKRADWGATVASNDDSFLRHIRRRFKTENAAKLAAFDLISSLLSKNI